jgi:hypothetical protein
MTEFCFPCHPERSEGFNFLMFFEKKEKHKILSWLLNDSVDFYNILNASTEIVTKLL